MIDIESVDNRIEYNGSEFMKIVLSTMVAAMLIGGVAVALTLQPAAPSDTLPTDTQSSDERVQQASQIEDATGLEYQNDADVHGDAPGTCETVDERRLLAVDDEEPMQAMMVEGDDEADAFLIPIGSEFEGERLTFELLPGTLNAELYEFSFDIVNANCGYSVFDPDAEVYHPPGPPDEPFDDSATMQSHELSARDSESCNPDEWKFNIKHDRGLLIGDLYVEWTNGDYTYIEHPADTSQVSKYLTSHNLEHTIARLVLQAGPEWAGSMTIAHGPCGVVEGEHGEIPGPSKEPLGGEFTVVEADQYVLIVTLEKGVVDFVQDQVPTRCHDDFGCFMYEEFSYRALLHTDQQR